MNPNILAQEDRIAKYGIKSLSREEIDTPQYRLLGSCTANSMIIEDCADSINLLNHPHKAKGVYESARETLASVFGYDRDKIIFDISGTHACLRIRALFPEYKVIMTDELGTSVEDAYKGFNPSSTDIHGNLILPRVIECSDEVEVVNLRKNGTTDPSAKDKILQLADKRTIVHLPAPSKTGITLDLFEELKQIGAITVADMAQTRNSQTYDADIHLLTTSKAMGGMPFTGVLMFKDDIGNRISKLTPYYMKHFVSGGHFYEREPYDIKLAARLLSSLKVANRALNEPSFLNNASDMKQQWSSMVEDTELAYTDISGDCDSIINFKLRAKGGLRGFLGSTDNFYEIGNPSSGIQRISFTWEQMMDWESEHKRSRIIEALAGLISKMEVYCDSQL